MEEIRFENKICQFLGIPAIPKKKWDKETQFDNGVAIIKRVTGDEDYAVCSFNSTIDENVRITKDFGFEPFVEIIEVYPVPAYMEDNIENMQLDEESKMAMEVLLEEKKEIVNKNVEKPKVDVYEWGYPFIKNQKEAEAYLAKNNTRGRIPTNKITLQNKLRLMYREEQNKLNK